MEVVCPKDRSVVSSPFSLPNIGALLKIKIISWSQETGLSVSVYVRVDDRIFNLHKNPLSSMNGYFNKRLNDSTDVDLPPGFPGGSDTFEMIALFIYGSSTLVDPFNVAALRCAAEFLEMTEDYCSSNLCERFDLYLNQVVLQSWDDTLIVLQKCQALLPWSEELLIVSRCIESCLHGLHGDLGPREATGPTSSYVSQTWNCETLKKIVSKDLWIKDLIALPFGFFKRIIGSLRRQAILQGVLDLLPMGRKAGRVFPARFYFALLSRSLEVGLRSDTQFKLQEQIASMLHFAQTEDFILPKMGTESISSSMELATIESIIST